MNNNSFEERGLVPGTNIPKPRYRDVYESDEEYVDYLKDYYSKYFPEIGSEGAEVKNNREINESKNTISDEEELSYIPFDISAISQEEAKEDIEISEIQKKSENFADNIIENEKMIKFDTNAASTDNDAMEVESITESNNVLKSKAKAPMLWQKAKNFFSNIKARLIEEYELTTEKANDYLYNNTSIYSEKTVAVGGKIR